MGPRGRCTWGVPQWSVDTAPGADGARVSPPALCLACAPPRAGARSSARAPSAAAADQTSADRRAQAATCRARPTPGVRAHPPDRPVLRDLPPCLDLMAERSHKARVHRPPPQWRAHARPTARVAATRGEGGAARLHAPGAAPSATSRCSSGWSSSRSSPIACRCASGRTSHTPRRRRAAAAASPCLSHRGKTELPPSALTLVGLVWHGGGGGGWGAG